MPNQRDGGGLNRRSTPEAERRRNAQTIIQVGYSMGASDRDVLIALMTAMQESTLRNIAYGDRDSLGLFQQRPSQGWGSRSQILDPEYAARKFYESLLRIKNRDSLSLTQAAQRVQRSAFPNAYAKWESYGKELLRTLGGGGRGSTLAPGHAVPASGGQPAPAGSPAGAAAAPTRVVGLGAPASSATLQPMPEWEAPAGKADISSAATSPLVETADQPVQMSQWTLNELDEEAFNQAFSTGGTGSGSGLAQKIIDMARGYIGTPYRWGGTSPLGFDCSGLIQYVYGRNGVNLPRVSFQQANTGTRVSFDQAAAGDLWFIDNSSRNNGADHIAIYLGDGQILEAPRTGLDVRIRSLSQREIASGGFTRVL